MSNQNVRVGGNRPISIQDFARSYGVKPENLIEANRNNPGILPSQLEGKVPLISTQFVYLPSKPESTPYFVPNSAQGLAWNLELFAPEGAAAFSVRGPELKEATKEELDRRKSVAQAAQRGEADYLESLLALLPEDPTGKQGGQAPAESLEKGAAFVNETKAREIVIRAEAPTISPADDGSLPVFRTKEAVLNSYRKGWPYGDQVIIDDGGVGRIYDVESLVRAEEKEEEQKKYDQALVTKANRLAKDLCRGRTRRGQKMNPETFVRVELPGEYYEGSAAKTLERLNQIAEKRSLFLSEDALKFKAPRLELDFDVLI